MLDAVASGRVDAVQLGALLLLLRAKGETGVELTALADGLRSRAVRPDIPPQLRHASGAAPLVDIVGTGGDGHDTINISTAACVVAAACGARVVKHGNRSASSMSGAADVLEKLGVPMLGPASIGKCVERAGVCFLFAPTFHPTLVHVASVRKALGVRTVFNFLGPLLNPAEPKRMVLGVYSPDLMGPYAEAVAAMGAEHALIVHCGGLDELAPVADAAVVRVRDGAVVGAEVLRSDDVGVPRCEIKDLKGGDAAFNAKFIRGFFAGGPAADAADAVHIVRTVALNAGAVLHVSGLAADIKDGYERALACIRGGDALARLDLWASVASSLKREEEEDAAKRAKVGAGGQ